MTKHLAAFTLVLAISAPCARASGQEPATTDGTVLTRQRVPACILPPASPHDVWGEEPTIVEFTSTSANQSLAEPTEPPEEIRLLVVHTAAARAALGDVQQYIDVQVNLTNQTYQDTGIAARIVLGGSFPFDYEEQPSLPMDLRAAIDSQAVRQHRGETLSDIVLVLTAGPGDACGVGGDYPVQDGHRVLDRSRAFATVRVGALPSGCNTLRYTVPHELGHVFGLLHFAGERDRNGNVVPDAVKPFGYGHIDPGRFKTIMAYGDGLFEVGYFSTPRLNAPEPNADRPLGIAFPDPNLTDEFPTSDGARAIDEVAPGIRNWFGNDGSICPDPENPRCGPPQQGPPASGAGSCGYLNWYKADDLPSCQNDCFTLNPDTAIACDKKQWCGSDPCPDYCWKCPVIPNGPPPSGGGGGGAPQGSTCSQMGWYGAGQYDACKVANNNVACAKKQVCNGGVCQPWPNYCWKPNQGPPPPDNPPDPPGAGRTCTEMGWFSADQLAACNDNGNYSCMKRQWCSTGPCEPWPHYCWKRP